MLTLSLSAIAVFASFVWLAFAHSDNVVRYYENAGK
jgi:hypothetical protein